MASSSNSSALPPTRRGRRLAPQVKVGEDIVFIPPGTKKLSFKVVVLMDGEPTTLKLEDLYSHMSPTFMTISIINPAVEHLFVEGADVKITEQSTSGETSGRSLTVIDGGLTCHKFRGTAVINCGTLSATDFCGTCTVKREGEDDASLLSTGKRARSETMPSVVIKNNHGVIGRDNTTTSRRIHKDCISPLPPTAGSPPPPPPLPSSDWACIKRAYFSGAPGPLPA